MNAIKWKQWVLLPVLFLLACNKNSNELPPVTPGSTPIMPDTAIQLIRLNSQDILRIRYIYYSKRASDTLVVRLTNLTGSPITGFSLLTELCKAKPKNFDNCNELKSLQGLTLNPNTDTALIIRTANPYIFADSLIYTALTQYSGGQYLLAGYYGNFNAYSYFVRDTSAARTGNYYGYLRGFIEADGRATFRLKGNDAAFYNVYGQFLPGNEFNGYLELNGSRSTDLKLDSFSTGASNVLFDTSIAGQLRLRFKLKDSLQNGLKAIDCYLKK